MKIGKMSHGSKEVRTWEETEEEEEEEKEEELWKDRPRGFVARRPTQSGDV
jgi:hypothetical protein